MPEALSLAMGPCLCLFERKCEHRLACYSPFPYAWTAATFSYLGHLMISFQADAYDDVEIECLPFKYREVLDGSELKQSVTSLRARIELESAPPHND
jgi:hypothetical protein